MSASSDSGSGSVLAKVVDLMLDDLQNSEERSAMIQQMQEDSVDSADKLSQEFDYWIEDAQAAASEAKDFRGTADALSRKLPGLVDLFQRLATACAYIITGESVDDGASEGDSYWWYEDEMRTKGGSVDPVQAKVLQTMHFFGLDSFIRDLVCLSILGPFAELLDSDESRYEPFHAVALAKSYDVISLLDITLGNSLTPFMQFCGAWGFASKVLPDTIEVSEGFQNGYGSVGEETRDEGTILHSFVESDSGRRTPNRSWEVCVASAIVLNLGGSLLALNSDNQTPMSLASTTDGILFGFFVRASLMGTSRSTSDINGTSRSPTAANGSGGESKEAATKAEVQALRDELRETKQQLGNILLLFGKILGLQQKEEGQQQRQQKKQPVPGENKPDSEHDDSDGESPSDNSSGSDMDEGDASGQGAEISIV